ncbi:MAG: RNA polymerase sigma factor [Bacteroidota bacterium]
MLTDKELVKECQRNNQKAQRQLYEKYKGRLIGLCLRYTKDRESAEDIFHEAFIKIYREIGNLRKVESLYSWLRSVTISTAINHYHKNRKHQDCLGIIDFEESNNDYDRIFSDLNAKELLALVQALPDGYRVVFNLYVIDGYKHKEIAEMLDISENTSKTQLLMAKRQLKKILEGMNITRYEKIN